MDLKRAAAVVAMISAWGVHGDEIPLQTRSMGNDPARAVAKIRAENLKAIEQARPDKVVDFCEGKKARNITLNEGDLLAVVVPWDGGAIFPTLLSGSSGDRDDGPLLAGFREFDLGRGVFLFVAIAPGRAKVEIDYQGGVPGMKPTAYFKLAIAINQLSAEQRVDRALQRVKSGKTLSPQDKLVPYREIAGLLKRLDADAKRHDDLATVCRRLERFIEKDCDKESAQKWEELLATYRVKSGEPARPEHDARKTGDGK